MEDLEDVRKRMRDKKYKKEPVLNDRMFSRFYRFAVTTMATFVVVLIVSCFIKANPNTDIRAFIDEHILSILPIPFIEEDKVVSQSIDYTSLEGNYYQGNDQNIYALEDGLIQSVKENSFIVLYQNGVVATYDQLASTNIKAYNRIHKGEVLGTYEQKFYMKLTKNEVEVSYEEIFT